MRPILIFPAGFIIFILLLGIGTGINYHLNPDEYARYEVRQEAEEQAKQAEEQAKQAEEQAKRTQEYKEQAYQEAVERKEAAAERQREIESAEFEKEYEKYLCTDQYWKDIGGYDWRVERGLDFNENCCMWVYPDLGCPP